MVCIESSFACCSPSCRTPWWRAGPMAGITQRAPDNAGGPSNGERTAISGPAQPARAQAGRSAWSFEREGEVEARRHRDVALRASEQRATDDAEHHEHRRERKDV